MRATFTALISLSLLATSVSALEQGEMTDTAKAYGQLQALGDKDIPLAKELEDKIYETLYYGKPSDRVISEEYVVGKAIEGDARAAFTLYLSPRIIYKLEGEKRTRQYWLEQAYLRGSAKGARAYAASILDSDTSRAVLILKDQAEIGNAEVAVYLSDLEGQRALPGITEQEIVTYLESAAEFDPYAMDALAARYQDGDGVARDKKKADELYDRAQALKSMIQKRMDGVL